MLQKGLPGGKVGLVLVIFSIWLLGIPSVTKELLETINV